MSTRSSRRTRVSASTNQSSILLSSLRYLSNPSDLQCTGLTVKERCVKVVVADLNMPACLITLTTFTTAISGIQNFWWNTSYYQHMPIHPFAWPCNGCLSPYCHSSSNGVNNLAVRTLGCDSCVSSSFVVVDDRIIRHLLLKDWFWFAKSLGYSQSMSYFLEGIFVRVH